MRRRIDPLVFQIREAVAGLITGGVFVKHGNPVRRPLVALADLLGNIEFGRYRPPEITVRHIKIGSRRVD